MKITMSQPKTILDIIKAIHDKLEIAPGKDKAKTEALASCSCTLAPLVGLKPGF